MASSNHTIPTVADQKQGVETVDCPKECIRAASTVSLNPAEIQDIEEKMKTRFQSKQLEAFHDFPSLPVELQPKVWYLIFSIPRVIELDVCAKACDCCNGRQLPKIKPSSRIPPAVLFTCSTSRLVALKVYEKRTFAKESTLPYRSVYYNAMRDILSLSHWHTNTWNYPLWQALCEEKITGRVAIVDITGTDPTGIAFSAIY